MEKLNNIPRNFVSNVKFESSPNSPNFNDFGKFNHLNSFCIKARIEIIIDVNNDEDKKFIGGLRQDGLNFVANTGFDIEKFKEIINAGMVKLPFYINHKDPDLAKMAWILSKYFAQKNDIIPDTVIE